MVRVGAIVSQGLPFLVSYPKGGCRIHVGNNIRLYPSETSTSTYKVSLSDNNNYGSLEGEIRARERLSDTSLAIPGVLRHDAQYQWMEEELIDTTSLTNHITAAKAFIQTCATFLYQKDQDYISVDGLLSRYSVWPDDIDRTLSEVGLKLRSDWINLEWPIALVHGDLKATNIIASSSDKIYAVDWEAFGRDVVAWDLRKLIFLMPDALVDLLERLNFKGIGARDQLRVVAALEIVLHTRDRGPIIQRKLCEGMTLAGAIAHHDQKIRSYRRLLLSL